MLFGLINGLLNIGMIPLIGQLSNNVTGLGSPGPSGVNLICNKAIHVRFSINAF